MEAPSLQKPTERDELESLSVRALVDMVISQRRLIEDLQGQITVLKLGNQPAAAAVVTPATSSGSAVTAATPAPTAATDTPTTTTPTTDVVASPKPVVEGKLSFVWNTDDCGTLSVLPPELLFLILRDVPLATVLKSLAAVSRKFNTLSKTNALWKVLFYDWYKRERAIAADAVGPSLAKTEHLDPLPPIDEYNIVTEPDTWLALFRRVWSHRNTGTIRPVGGGFGKPTWTWNATTGRLSFSAGGRYTTWLITPSGTNWIIRLSTAPLVTFEFSSSGVMMAKGGRATTIWRITPTAISATGPLTAHWSVNRRPLPERSAAADCICTWDVSGGPVQARTNFQVAGLIPLPLVALAIAGVHEKIL
eukprot:TRINITY_DN16214_c0_g1_i1.p1 TRINITY_DN16214_c0_g1~~TRINITY_DN16214_c0_g1_i1.p1  ORF type:complete len:363 (-),score=46.57 TRINITY_DN16214_c0_g1_i1:8-1096(-)